MPKLPVLKSKEAVKVVGKIGFLFARQKGSHAIYKKDDELALLCQCMTVI